MLLVGSGSVASIDSAVGIANLRACLAEQWGLPDPRIDVHNGGMNSATWLIRLDGRRWVAKAVVATSGRHFRAGLAIATRLQQSGIAAGAPVPTRHGDLTTSVDGYPLALLSWVPGTPLAGADPGEQRLIGATLARVHERLKTVEIEDVERFHWVDPGADHLAVRPWIRTAVASAVAALDALGPDSLSQGLLHCDPAPEAFRRDPEHGECGLIDWSAAVSGPLLYDLASAVMYIGGPERAGPLVDAYLEQAVIPAAEVQRALPTMLRFRWAVQADYFARRIATNDLTGIDGAAVNEKGLADARRWLVTRDWAGATIGTGPVSPPA